MKTRSFKKVICLMMCAAAVASMSVPAWAADVGEIVEKPVARMVALSPRYEQTTKAQSVLGIKDGKAVATALVMGSSSVNKVSITATLQKKVDGGWSGVKTWSASSSSAKCSLDKTTNVSKGTYRLHVSFTTYAGSKKESGTVNSSTQNY